MLPCASKRLRVGTHIAQPRSTQRLSAIRAFHQPKDSPSPSPSSSDLAGPAAYCMRTRPGPRHMSQAWQGGLATTAILAGPELPTVRQAVDSASSNSTAHGVPIFWLPTSIVNQSHLSSHLPHTRLHVLLLFFSSPSGPTTVRGPLAEKAPEDRSFNLPYIPRR